jgi:hypothetical protein
MNDKDQFQQINTFSGGMNKDATLENIKPDSYIDANDITVLPDAENEIMRIASAQEMAIITNPVSLTYPTTQIFRIVLDSSAVSIAHDFRITTMGIFAVTTFTATSAAGTALLRFNALIAQIITSTTTLNAGVAPTVVSDFASGVITLNFTSTTFEYYGTEAIGGAAPMTLELVQEKHSYGGVAYYDIVGGKPIGKDLFLLIHTNGTGMIAVAKKDEASGTWATTRLLQSKNIDLDRDRVYKIQIDQNNDFINVYWVDGVTEPQSFSIKKQTTWVTDSALMYTPSSFITPTTDALYTYSNLTTLLGLQVFNNTAEITNITINNTGGFFTNENKQFAIRFKIGGGYTGFALLSKPVSVFGRDTGDFTGGGSAPETVTTKSLTLDIEDVRDDIYDYYQIGVIEYTGGAVAAYVIGDFPVLGSSFSITILGNENRQALDLTTFNELSPVFKTAHLNEIVENKYFIGRIETAADPDLASWVETEMFSDISVIATTLDGVGVSDSSPDPLAEYMDFDNIENYIGYMYGELERFGARFLFKNGLITPTYFGKDITIENDITGKLGNLTNNTGTEVYSYSFRFNSIDFSTAPDVDGVPFYEAIDKIEIMRRETIPSIVDTGYVLVPNNSETVASPSGGFNTYYKAGEMFSTGNLTGFISNSVYCAFISQNLLINGDSGLQEGDSVISYGCPLSYNIITGTGYLMKEYTGFFDASPTTQTEDIEIAKLGQFGEAIFIERATNRIFMDARGQATIGTFIVNNSVEFALKLSNPLANTTANTDLRGYYVQVKRNIDSNRYGPKTSGQYISTGRVIDGTDVAFSNISVFGGDTYTQKCYQKIAYSGISLVPAPIKSAVSYYAQNRFNAQMSYTDDSTPVFPLTTQGTIDAWVTINGDGQEVRLYDSGFTNRNNVRTGASYNGSIRSVNKMDTTYFYSDEKLEGDLSDPFKTFRFANSKTYELSDGVLTGLYRIRGNLAVIQERAFRIQPISPTALQSSEDVGDIILGTGSVTGTKDTSLSTFGAQEINHSVFFVARSGTEYIYFYDHDKKAILRYGVDGLKVVSEINFMSNFLKNNTRYIEGTFGLTMGYNRYMDEVWLVANNPQGESYDAGDTYSAGDLVTVNVENPDSDPGITYDFLNQFKARTSVATGNEPDYYGDNFNLWDLNRNSNFALAFSERFNMFSTFYTIKPRLSFQYLDNMLSVLPYTDNNTGARNCQFVEHDNGTTGFYLPFIKTNSFVEMSVSPQANEFKRALKCWVNIEDDAPDSVIIQSDNGTADRITDFEQRRGRTIFNIKKDFYGTGQRVGGNKLRIKMFFDYSKKIHNFVSTVIFKHRKFNS